MVSLSPAVAFVLLSAALILVVAAAWKPQAVIAVASFLIIVVRPDSPLWIANVAGIAITQADLALIACLLAATFLNLRQRTSAHLTGIMIMAWPIWLALRTHGLPQIDGELYEGSLVAYQAPAFFCLYFVYRRLDATSAQEILTRWICALGALTATIGLSAWLLNRIGILPTGDYPLVLVSGSTDGDVRPGGEIVLVASILLTIFGSAGGVTRGGRYRLALSAAALLVSQTLSIMLALVLGCIIGLLIAKRVSPRIFVGTLAIVVIGILAALGVVAQGSRFDLTDRISSDSSNYRIAEVAKAQRLLLDSPYSLTFGGGGGIRVNMLGDPLIQEVKRDTHNVFINVLLQTGLIGLFLYLLPYTKVAWRNRRSRASAPTAATILTLLFMSLTVPQLWTAGGTATAALLLACLTSTQWQRSPQPSEKLPQTDGTGLVRVEH